MVIAVLAALAAWAAWRLPETVATSGKRISLTPRVPRVPRALWRTFGLSALGVLASWSVGGLYLSLGPSIIGQLHATQNHAVGGLFVFVFSACAVLGQWVLRDVGNRPTLVGGAGLLAVGSVITAASVSRGSLDGFLLGSLVVGFGFGAAFMGALRTLASTLPPAHRAGVMAAFFVVAYFAISVPAIGAGVAAVHIGLTSAVDVVRGRRRDRRGTGLGGRLVRAPTRSAGRLSRAAGPQGRLTIFPACWMIRPACRIHARRTSTTASPSACACCAPRAASRSPRSRRGAASAAR